jgi:hypothetical protein
MIEVEEAYETLAAWCRARGWAEHDPFSGGGTTLVRANKSGLHAAGVDVSAFNALSANVISSQVFLP